MRKDKITQEQSTESAKKNLPDLEVIDLEQEENIGTSPAVESPAEKTPAEKFPAENSPYEALEQRSQRRSFLHNPFQHKATQEDIVPEEPVQEKSVAKESAAKESVAEDFVIEELIAEESSDEEPAEDDFAIEDLVPEEPVIPKPIFTKSVAEEPASAPIQEITVEKKTVQKVPVQKIPVQKIPIQESPVQESPVSKVPVSKTPDSEEPVHGEQEWEEPHETIDIAEEDMYAHQKAGFSGTLILEKLRPYLNIHVLLAAVAVICITCIVVKFSNWGEYIDPSEIDHENAGTYLDVLDQILPLTDAEGRPISTGKVDTILAFGNAPFADSRGSDENLATLISKATGATVYNCSVSGSYLAAQHPFFDAGVAPMDAYTFYWLATLAVSGANAHYYRNAAEALGINTPFDAEEVYNTLTTIDMNEVDVITVMYDASDYLMGHEMYDDANETNIQQFTGNLEAGIELIQENYPNIRIIVMSPTYAYAINENGDYVSSDMYRYGQDVLSTYVIKEYSSCASRSVTFIDHLYGTITEANASDYLIDNLHLNYEGRKLVTNRFVKALNYYNH